MLAKCMCREGQVGRWHIESGDNGGLYFMENTGGEGEISQKEAISVFILSPGNWVLFGVLSHPDRVAHPANDGDLFSARVPLTPDSDSDRRRIRSLYNLLFFQNVLIIAAKMVNKQSGGEIVAPGADTARAM